MNSSVISTPRTLPRVLAGETLTGTITYDDAYKLVTRAELNWVPTLR